MQLINRERAVLIDISEPAEYAAGHAVGARSVPLGQPRDARASCRRTSRCRWSSSARTARARRAPSRVLKKLGFEKHDALAGGLAAWRAANLPTEKTA